MEKFSAGTWLIEKFLEGTAYAGTGTKQELMELEKNLRQLLQLKMYPYMYIENYLVSQGYQTKDIRNIFKEISGISFSEFMSPDFEIRNVPDSIPSFNLGWGESKSKEFDFLFIMPWLLGYAIFGQTGDVGRKEIESFDILEDARAALKSKVKEYRQYNKVAEIKLEKPTEGWASSFSEPKFSNLSEQGKSLVDYVKLVNGSIICDKSKKYIKESYFNGTITKDDLVILLNAAENNEQPENAVELDNKQTEDALMEPQLEDDLKEVSPSDFFNNSIETDKNLSDIFSSIDTYLEEKSNDLLPDFTIALKSIKLFSTPAVTTGDENISTSQSAPNEYLKSSAIVAVVLTITDNKISETKPAMITLSVYNGELRTAGILKGIDKTRIAFTKDGLHKYFQNEESKQQNTSLF